MDIRPTSRSVADDHVGVQMIDKKVYATLDEVPWNGGRVKAVTASNGDRVGINADGFAAWLNGPRARQRIPLDAGSHWNDPHNNPDANWGDCRCPLCWECTR